MNLSGLHWLRNWYFLFVSSAHAGLRLLSDRLLALFLALFFAIREFERISQRGLASLFIFIEEREFALYIQPNKEKEWGF